MKIGFFDSGLGGLTILNEALKQIKAHYIYLADNKNTPYGIKSKELIKEYTLKNIDILVNKGCKVIVVACNTATSIAINELRKKYKDVCIIGTEPAVKRAIDDNLLSSNILVFATTTTVREEKLSNLITNLKAEDKVDLLALDELVLFAEKKIKDENKIREYLSNKLNEYDIKKYTHVVLGCTHFPLLKEYLKEFFEADTKFIDGSVGIVNNLKNKISYIDDCNTNNTDITLLLTKYNQEFINNYKRIIGRDDINIEVV